MRNLLAAFLVFLSVGASAALGQYKTIADYAPTMWGTSYVEAYAADASDHNIWTTDAATYPNLSDWLAPAGEENGKWWPKIDSTKAINGTAYQGKDSQTPPQLTMTATGLDNTQSYAVYAVYWAKNPALISSSWWYTRASLAGDPLIDCSYSNATNVFFDDGGTGVQGCEKFLGNVSGVSEISVLIEAPPTDPADQRAWFDGLSFGPALYRTVLSEVAARFTDGETDAAVDGFPGMKGTGWKGPWSYGTGHGATMTPTVPSLGAVELKPGVSGNYLQVTAEHPSEDPEDPNASYAGVRRNYKTDFPDPGIDWTRDHTIQFSIRIDENLSASFNSVDDRYQICETAGGYNADRDATWTVACYGGSDGVVANAEDVGVWTFFDGARDGGDRLAERNVETDVVVTAGEVYDFTIQVDVDTQSYQAVVTDGTNSYDTRDYFTNGLGWRTVAAEIGGYLVFDTRADRESLSQSRMFSLDDVVITQTPQSIPGDANGDGYVDSTDAAALAGHWGATVTAGDVSQGDFNGDGLVNAADASILAANWNPSPGEGTSVPEPAAVMLLAMGLLMFSMRRVR